MGTFPRVTHPSAADPEGPARLACVKPAASVRSEPGSNSQVENSIMTDHYVLNRRELTRSSNSITAPKNLVFSYQNVTVICLLVNGPKTIRETPPTTFLFLPIFNCQITDIRASKPKRQNPRSQTVKPGPSASQPILCDFQKRTQSALEAPPPSSVSGVIDPPSETVNTNRQRNFMKMISN
jgi:hypothetical protein